MKKQENYGFIEKLKLCKNRFNPALVVLLTIFIVIALNLNGFTQEKELKVSKDEQEQVIEKVGKILEANYVYPETAKKMSSHISGKLKKGDYKKITSPNEFADQVGKDLREISKDLHIRVGYDPEEVKRMRKRAKNKDDPELLELRLKRLRRTNFGFNEVKILSGNIGYLDLTQFADPKYAGETAVAAMNFLANCEILIIDLRNNGGGSAGMIQLLTSYFYDDEPVHLNTFYWRPSDETQQTWTLPHVPGKKVPDIDIYVLTGNRTFSAAEEFSYNLKNLKRATLVGDTTRGGAHPGGLMVINDNFLIWVPKGRAINPITKTNWEGVGVKPHIEVPQKDALKTAHLKALEKLAAGTKDKDDKFRYEWYKESLKAELNPVKVKPETLKLYEGKYGPRTITFENGELFYQRIGRPKYRMIPLADDLFMFKEIDYFRIKIIKEDGTVKGVMGMYDNMVTDKNLKEK
ncbi:MAG: S41 family peptidase [Candidatus Aminicenantes bacterium]|nr:MAG: S41 family peptidase [Candidatus Aminicenantes bacterium]